MEQPIPVKEVKILETAEDIQERREQVLNRYLMAMKSFPICRVYILKLDMDMTFCENIVLDFSFIYL